MAAAAQEVNVEELAERVDALELLVAKYVRSNGNGNGSTRTERTPEPPNDDEWNVRPLRFVRWPKPCFVCGVEVRAGARAVWVPALKSKGLACEGHSPGEYGAAIAEARA